MRYLWLFLLACSVSAQELPDKPTLGRTDKILLTALTGLNTYDAVSTMRAVTNGVGHEQNAMARPFVTHGNTLAVSYFGAATALDWFVVYKLNKHGHRTMARLFLIGAIAAESYCIIPKHQTNGITMPKFPDHPIWTAR